ncbi:hypothetical protein KOI35_20455 [Actinoplanes bogorensis]|uniref:Glycosyl transferase family 2 n=1 Tax=Paractinoplanes bogorensis TaxID=1610840 RepID=A0ABS5YS20_9ACTN|nr:hypothetical protein [Actinoplanes bogorensis]MBU2665886.1 hypothetical protein [Actinoplanes bogorensis]
MSRLSWRPGDVRLSVAIMHHPVRGDAADRIVEACRPLVARVVTDPAPNAVRSPLRTAKVAWAAIAEGATHHLVLQDDARVADGFADLVAEAIAGRPRHGIALYTDWISPQNSYLSRLAAVAGSPWAPLSPMEWTPALAFLLPAGTAAELASYLAPIPDEVTDDDQMMARFCRERSVPLLATVPHLVDNRGMPTLISGHGGRHHATVWAAPAVPPAGHWDVDPRIDEALAARSQYRRHDEYVVQVKDSRCSIRLLRPRTGEPGGNEFCWYWDDWCDLIGVGGREVTAGLAACLDTLDHRPPPRVATEIWAAGYLLGLDAAQVRRGLSAPLAVATPGAIRAAVSSWVHAGLAAPLDAADRAALIELGSAAVALGLRRRRPDPLVAAGVPAGAHGEDIPHDNPYHHN